MPLKIPFSTHTGSMSDTQSFPVGRYFDHNGSTPLLPSVARLCLDLIQAEWGNSSAPHPVGRNASVLVEEARSKLAASLNASPEEIYFTSGGTEANNWVFFGLAARRKTGHIVISAIEHSSVLEPARELERRGFSLTLVRPREDGAVHLRDIQAALREDTFLVSVMWANNETGVCQPVREIASLCRKRGVLFHCDAVAAMGKLPIDMCDVECDMLSISAHKFHAPKGVGALYLRKGVEITPLHFGCGHQQGLRSGTENTVGVVAMAAAAELVLSDAPARQSFTEARRQQLWNGIRDLLPEAERNGGGGMLPNTLNVHFPSIPAKLLQNELALSGFSVAAGASASKGSPSHVLIAMGLSPERATSSIRFSLGSETSVADIEDLLEHLGPALSAVRASIQTAVGTS
jgi:cysteine desulfurase